MGWSIVRVLASAGLVVCGTTSCMIVNLDGDEGPHGGKRPCHASCPHAGGGGGGGGGTTAGGGGTVGDPAPPPGLRPGVVQVFRVNGAGAETAIGYGSQDPGNASYAHWVLANDQQYPVNLAVGHSLKLKLLTTANETSAQLCTRAKDAGIASPKVWRVSQAIDTTWPCPAE